MSTQRCPPRTARPAGQPRTLPAPASLRAAGWCTKCGVSGAKCFPLQPAPLAAHSPAFGENPQRHVGSQPGLWKCLAGSAACLCVANCRMLMNGAPQLAGSDGKGSAKGEPELPRHLRPRAGVLPWGDGGLGGRGPGRRDGVAGFLGLSISMDSSAELPLPTSPGPRVEFCQPEVLQKEGLGSFPSPGARSCLHGGHQRPFSSCVLWTERGLTRHQCGDAGLWQQHGHPPALLCPKSHRSWAQSRMQPRSSVPRGRQGSVCEGSRGARCCPSTEHLLSLGQSLRRSFPTGTGTRVPWGSFPVATSPSACPRPCTATARMTAATGLTRRTAVSSKPLAKRDALRVSNPQTREHRDPGPGGHYC